MKLSEGNLFFSGLKQIINPLLENRLYQKCGEIISIKLGNMFDPNTKYTILGKSAGGGVSICLSEIIYKQIHKMNPEQQKEWENYIDEFYYIYHNEKMRKISSEHPYVIEGYKKIIDKLFYRYK